MCCWVRLFQDLRGWPEAEIDTVYGIPEECQVSGRRYGFVSCWGSREGWCGRLWGSDELVLLRRATVYLETGYGKPCGRNGTEERAGFGICV